MHQSVLSYQDFSLVVIVVLPTIVVRHCVVGLVTTETKVLILKYLTLKPNGNDIYRLV
jgi:hypothetical protein